MTNTVFRDMELMKQAFSVANSSKAEKRKVGCILLLPGNRIVKGFNRTFEGLSCEDKHGNTKGSVIHAEEDAIFSAIKQFNGILPNGIMYVTHAPCLNCAKLIVHYGIIKLFYSEMTDKFRQLKGGINAESLLLNNNVEIQQISNTNLHNI